MDRRQFMKLCLALPLLATAQAAKAKKQHVVVVGAGLSGLQAALKLSQAGMKVTVLEGRARLGGRAWTSRLWSDLPVDLGGSWIHGQTGNPLVRLAKAAGATPKPFNYDSVQYYWAEGQAFSDAEETQLDRLSSKIEAYLEDNENQTGQKVSRVLQDIATELSAKQQRMFNYATVSEIEHNIGSPIAELSVAGYMEGDDFRGGDLFFSGQTGLMTDYLAAQVQALAGNIRLKVLVQALQPTARGVNIQTNSGTIQADYVVLTAPLGVLQAKSMVLPKWSADMQQAMSELRMGSLEKLVLRFPRVFWPTENYISRIPELAQAGQWVDAINLYPFTQKPALMLFNGGTEGRRSNNLSDQALVQSAMTALRRIFPKAPDPLAAQRSRWGQDPLCMGSYSFATGKDPEAAREALQEPIQGRIWLAGEHTSLRAPQSFHGAYLEGQRVAQQLLSSI